MKVYAFEELEDAPLIVGARYKGGCEGNISDDPFSKLLKVENSGGFRKRNMRNSNNLVAFVVIFSTGNESEWPDFLDNETGIFRYYGDNRTPGHALHDTKKGGNRILSEVFRFSNNPDELQKIPPFLVFRGVGKGRDVEFVGMAVPGTRKFAADKELVSFWRTSNGERFQNYEAYFTILDETEISKDWLRARIENYPRHEELAPITWKKFIELGRHGIVPLEAPIIKAKPPSKQDQLPKSDEGKMVIKKILERYRSFPQDFEKCAADIVRRMDGRFTDFKLTRPWRDGGYDAICVCRIGIENILCPLKIHCAIEAKLYSHSNGVGVKEMSRLISRIKYREMGILVTTSYICSQAYEEVMLDGHPILMVTGGDIAEILIRNGITSDNVDEWLEGIGSSGEIEF